MKKLNFEELKLAEFLYGLQVRRIRIWAEKENIKLFLPVGCELGDEEKRFIKEHKRALNGLLTSNAITQDRTFGILAMETQVAPLAFSQERFWFIQALEPKSALYNKPIIFKLEIRTNLQYLHFALVEVMKRHSILRTLFKREGQVLCQEVVSLENYPLILGEVHCKDLSEIKQKWQTDYEYHFQLDRELPVLFKVYVDQQKKQRYLLILVHHIVFDGWSSNFLFHELNSIYEALVGNVEVNLKKLPIQYKDFAIWQRYALDPDVLTSDLNYWKKELTDYEAVALIKDRERPFTADYNGSEYGFTINAEISIKLRSLARKLNVTLYTVLLAGFAVCLRTFTQQDDLVIGTPMTNRHHSQLESMIGPFLNSLVLRIRVNRAKTVIELIHSVGETVRNAQLHQSLPFEKIVETIESTRDYRQHPIFQIMFGLQNFSETRESQVHGILLPFTESIEHRVATFDISMFITDEQALALSGFVNYATSLFDLNTIEAMTHAYKLIMQQFSTLVEYEQDIELSRLKLVSDAVVIQAENRLQHTPTFNIVSLFETQVAKTPQSAAIIYKDRKITYADLDFRSNQLAHYLLRNYPVTTDKLVVVILERNEWLPIVLLAVLKTGAAFLPVDPAQSLTRTSQIIKETEPCLLITGQAIQSLPEIGAVASLILDSLSVQLIQSLPGTKLDTNIKLNHLAYAIYTSGSTGVPKAVLIEHLGIVNTMLAQREYLKLDRNKNIKFGLVTSYVFDATIAGIFQPLLFGNSLIIADKDEGLKLLDFVISYEVNVMILPAAMLALLPIPQSAFTLELLVIGGEKPDKDKVMHLLAKGVRIIQEYGLTETSVTSTFCELSSASNIKNIGRPISNTRGYVLDRNYRLLPSKATGEFFIAGLGLARGYLNATQLNAERFIQHPSLGRLFKTGDLVRALPNGDFEYIARLDKQIKLSGFRIDPIEIAEIIKGFPGVEQAIVTLKSMHGNPVLIAYYCCQDKLDEADLMSHLQMYLPSFSLPSHFVSLATLPLNNSGKVDEKALPLPSMSGPIKHANTALEAKIIELWSEVLSVPISLISSTSDFFKIGGNSIKLVQLHTKILQHIPMATVAIADLFRYTTPSSSALKIEGLKHNSKKNIQAPPGTEGVDIAVIAMSGAFSGCENLDEYWQMLITGNSGISHLTMEECLAKGVSSERLNRLNYIPSSGHINGIKNFDPKFWDMSPLEAKLTDPQFRKFWEHGWNVLEQAGYLSDPICSLNVGVFSGCGYSDYLYENILKNPQGTPLDMWSILQSNGKDFLATRTSYLLGLTGPALNINTACSTALVAIAEACDKLRLGQCEMALAGGVSLLMPHLHGYQYEPGMILSKTGVCRPFDENADGTVEGSGVGVVLLKRLADAKRDGDNIIAVIKGYSINNDGGRKSSYAAPSLEAQSECIEQAQRMAGLASDQINYIECHGTATSLGDAIELSALQEAFYNNSNKSSESPTCYLGAVKANIGHTDSAAGVAGVIKICLMLANGTIPQQIHFDRFNTKHSIHPRFKINTRNICWDKRNEPRIAGVSSFGIGGTNAHMIIKESEQTTMKAIEPVKEARFCFVFSAMSSQSLQRYMSVFARFLERNNNVSLKDVAYTLQHKRRHFSWRCCLVADSVNTLLKKLKEKQFAITEKIATSTSELIFVFPGQGSQYSNMGLELYRESPIFKEAMDHCFEIINSHIDFDFKSLMFLDAGQVEGRVISINDTRWAQSAIFCVSYSCAKLLESLNLMPAAYFGHSIGEYVAATLAGVWSLDVALRVVLERSRLMQSMPKGKMLTVQIGVSALEKYMGNGLEIAAINSDDSTVVSGSEEEIQRLLDVLRVNGVNFKELPTSHAFHSKLMQPAADQLQIFMNDIQMNHPQKPFVSNLTGNFADAEEVTTSEYWASQLRSCVQFSRGVETLQQSFKQAVFIEVGAGGGMPFFIRGCCTTIPASKEYSVGRKQGLLDILGKAWTVGLPILSNSPYMLEGAKLVHLPTYQFEEHLCWIYGVRGEEKRNLENTTAENFTVAESINEVEKVVAEQIAQLLGIEHLSKFDNFFELGGNSILATQLLNRINRHFQSKLTVGDLYINNTISLLGQCILQNKQSYQAVLRMNSSGANDLLFMIHPGAAGCEVYTDLAEKLVDDFCCYGVDSFNLYHDKKILSIDKLALFYTEQIEAIMQERSVRSYYLLGWSLGGHIALEIAAVLEMRGAESVKVFLLDTMLFCDATSSALISKVDMDHLIKEYHSNASMSAYDSDYINRVANNLALENHFVTQPISEILTKTEVYLFKAMQEDPRFSTEGFAEASAHMVLKKYNNVDQFVKNENLFLIEMTHSHHGTVLSNVETIKKVLNQSKTGAVYAV